MTRTRIRKRSTASRRTPPARKFAISLPADLYEAMEKARAGAGRDRSSWIREAAREYLSVSEREAKIAQYIRGYEEVPETDEEFEFVAGAVNDPLPPYERT